MNAWSDCGYMRATEWILAEVAEWLQHPSPDQAQRQLLRLAIEVLLDCRSLLARQENGAHERT